MQNNIEGIYQKQKEEYGGKAAAASKEVERISALRLITFLFFVGLGGYGLFRGNTTLVFFSLLPLGAFVALVVKHARGQERAAYLQNMVGVNERSINRLKGKWTSFAEKGQVYANPEHPYSTDLNIFGQGSLFQYSNSTSTILGEESLASLLQGREGSEKILLRQEAVAELVKMLGWRQHLQATGMGGPQRGDHAKVRSFAASKADAASGQKNLNKLLYLPVVTFTLLVLFVLDVVPLPLPLLFIVLQTVVVLFSEKYIGRAFGDAVGAVDNLKRYAALLGTIETQKFTSSHLRDLQKELLTGSRLASEEVAELAKIAERIKFRFYQPIIYFPVNVLTLWDLYTYKRLLDWKRKGGQSIPTWFSVIGEYEALSSLAGLAHENPHWTFPTIVTGPPTFEAKGLGHPLIPASLRVGNDVSLPSPGTSLIITGSNMSGKTTLLRTVGTNLILAYTGAPVCASHLTCSYLPVYSKMQIADNLEQGVSTYYAELKRIKMVIDAALEGEPLIYLLDEIFRGTNSRDRILGTKTVIKKLAGLSTLGLLTTHDLELGGLAADNPARIKNYHFTDSIENGRINFDYKLKPGISRSTNAIALMQMVGIDVEDISHRKGD